MSKEYIVYDGRALTEGTGDATILEALGHQFLARDFRLWQQHDAVLVEYTRDGTSLTNERIVGHMSEGYDALKAKL